MIYMSIPNKRDEIIVPKKLMSKITVMFLKKCFFRAVKPAANIIGGSNTKKKIDGSKIAASAKSSVKCFEYFITIPVIMP